LAIFRFTCISTNTTFITRSTKKQAEARMTTAQRLTWLAIAGEYLYRIKLWFFHQFLLLLRAVYIGGEANKEINQGKQAVWLKENLINLGPTFIKIGQSLGTRADLLPLPFVKALGELQDNVPSFPNQIAFARIEKELGKKIAEVYAEFDAEPIAAASLGQVYRAKLFTGEEVAVKVQRPNLQGIIKGDIEILRKVAKFAERFPSLNDNADLAGMLGEFDENGFTRKWIPGGRAQTARTLAGSFKNDESCMFR
jgi:predicted unusual protein kinase regulating ubiquinone biosynthesis (AarF/ABC1/UbiB family)